MIQKDPDKSSCGSYQHVTLLRRVSHSLLQEQVFRFLRIYGRVLSLKPVNMPLKPFRVKDIGVLCEGENIQRQLGLPRQYSKVDGPHLSIHHLLKKTTYVYPLHPSLCLHCARLMNIQTSNVAVGVLPSLGHLLEEINIINGKYKIRLYLALVV